jgi:hypothetical protein
MRDVLPSQKASAGKQEPLYRRINEEASGDQAHGYPTHRRISPKKHIARTFGYRQMAKEREFPQPGSDIT